MSDSESSFEKSQKYYTILTQRDAGCATEDTTATIATTTGTGVATITVAATHDELRGLQVVYSNTAVAA